MTLRLADLTVLNLLTTNHFGRMGYGHYTGKKAFAQASNQSFMLSTYDVTFLFTAYTQRRNESGMEDKWVEFEDEKM